MNRFQGQTAIITGAGGGMGHAIAYKLASEGADLVVTDISNSALTDVVESLKDLKSKVEGISGDLADKSFCDGLPDRVNEMFGRLDIVVNNAGLMRRGAITQASDDDLAMSMAINVEAPFRICRSAIPIMAAADGGGRIVNIASCWGLYPGPDHLVYCTTKGALATMTRCLGRDHAHQNIRINAVCPNEVNTPMLRTGFEIRGLDPDKAIDVLNESVPIGRIAQPEEIANVVSFLASDESSYMCGACVEVNGGKPVY